MQSEKARPTAPKKSKPRPFAVIPRRLWTEPDFTKLDICVMSEMASACDGNRLCWLSVDTIAARVKALPGSVKKSRARLARHGLIAWFGWRTMPGRGLTVAVYRVLKREAEVDGPATPAVEAEVDEPATPAAEPGYPEDKAGVAEMGSRGSQEGGPGSLAEPPNHEAEYESLKEEDDDEGAPERDASSSSALNGELLAEEDEAALAFHELAERKGWPTAGAALTRKERRQMTARLAQCGGLEAWRALMIEAERSTYLALTKPGLKFFLSEDNLAQHARGVYAPERDRKSAFQSFGEAVWRATQEAPSSQPPPAEREQSAEPQAAPKRDPLNHNLDLIAAVTYRSIGDVHAMASEWLKRLQSNGLDRAAAKAILSEIAIDVPKTGHAIEGMNERIARHIEKRSKAA